MNTYDIAVIGGGFSGVCAAIAAARQGASVLLAERGNCLGGAAVTCLVNPFMPYWTQEGNQRKFLSAGLFREILEELREAGGLGKGDMTFHEEILKLVLNRMVLRAGVKLLFHSYLTQVTVENGQIQDITLANKSGNMIIKAKYFIDATGDADLAVLSGCPYHLGREADQLCQPMTLCFRLGNVDLAAFEKSKNSINPLYQQFQREGKIKNPREDVLIFPTLLPGVLHFNSTRIVKRNPVDAEDITNAEIEAREQVFELYHFLKENIDGFQNAELLMTAMQTGARESRMIDGDYLLTAEDLKNCIKFEDAIAAGNYDIDIHNPEGSGTSHYYFPQGVYYTIPYRSLIPQKTENLLAAGRCISSTHEAQASYRIMPICSTLGQAAGTAAALALKDSCSVRAINISRLQETLKQHGAFF
ncbi:FAD-dependent oxidoreductase [Ructibacterium gallinarum]|uniref:FAD-dependent oxidoreductase n=1 Tax=Ructibacterium gallinarum TaxID=2779355 RepID=A0A9D5R883_9FIRM|nr:FAD-dependent oxidoreductase [Ructibacterium gallinarum]MBE5039700.1 FAD-dependent oxidoreductase [Ructibacterium gallinarum]